MIFISKLVKKDFKSVGDLTNFEKIPKGISLEFTNGKGKILFYSSKLIRFIITTKNEFELDHSYAVIKNLEEWTDSSYNVKDEAKQIVITTQDLIIELEKAPYRAIIKQGNVVLCEDIAGGMGACASNKTTNIRSYKKVREIDHYFGFGEKTGPLDKKGELLVMDGRDMPYKGDKEPLYQNHPYFITINKGIAHAIFLDNISKTSFDMGKSNKEEYYFDTATGELNYYFIYGPSIDEILELYTELTGRMEMPPKWSIGYHQCRYSYRNEKEIKEITSKFRDAQIPCDVIWFDIHYMEGYRCFTFNNKRFPDPKRLMGELKEDGFKPVVIVDPGIKVDENYAIYQELMEKKYYTPRADGEPSLGLVWPGLTHFPDFTREEVREWWCDKHQYYFDLGILGIWNDMNEPAFSINPVLSTIKRLHPTDMYLDDQGRNTVIEHSKNVYALCENWATWMGFKKFMPNKRPFLLTRSGYSGIQRYAAIWTGDNWTNWKGITLALRMCLNLNLSAQAFCGSDVGGFAGIIKFLPYILRDKKQFIRWIQSATIGYPFCRVHTALGTKSQDPFSYGKQAQEISKKYIELRYELFPYWYTLFYNYHKKGAPIIRPIFYETPDDEECYNKKYENQFFLGKDILVIPIDKRNVKNKAIYLPEGSWIQYWTLEEYQGKQEYIIPITLEDIPIFIRKGAIIPTQEVIEYVGQKPIDALILKIYKGEIGTTSEIMVYEDDGESIEYKDKDMFCLIDIKCEYGEKESKLSISPKKGSYKPSWKLIKYIAYENGMKIIENSENYQETDQEIIF